MGCTSLADGLGIQDCPILLYIRDPFNMTMTMKHLLAPLALAVLPLFTLAQDLPAPSPSATVKQRIGITDVTITYSRPSMKGRQVFGGLVPYGEIWRTGANGSTILSTTGALVINDQKLPAGDYAVFTVPNDGAWVVMFNKNTKLWGATGYKPEEDVLTIKAATREVPMTESFTMGFENLGQDRAELVFRWEKQEAFVSIVADANDQSMANIKAALADPKADYSTYYKAARFYKDRDLGMKEALGYATKSVSMTKKYWNTFQLAEIQAAMNMYAEAAANAREAMALAGQEGEKSTVAEYEANFNEWTAKAAGK